MNAQERDEAVDAYWQRVYGDAWKEAKRQFVQKQARIKVAVERMLTAARGKA